MQRLPDAGLLPGPQSPPARHPGAVAELLRQVAPGDPGMQHVQDPVECLAVIQREPARMPEASLADRDQRLDLGPQPVIDLEARGHLHDLQRSGTPPPSSRPTTRTLHSETASKADRWAGGRFAPRLTP